MSEPSNSANKAQENFKFFPSFYFYQISVREPDGGDWIESLFLGSNMMTMMLAIVATQFASAPAALLELKNAYPSANSKTLITLTVRVSAKYSSVWCLPTISTIPASRDWHNLNFDCGKKYSCQPKWCCLPQAFRQHRVVHFLSSTPSYKQSLFFDLGAKATVKKEIRCWSSYRQAFPQRLQSRLGRTTPEQAIIFRL